MLLFDFSSVNSKDTKFYLRHLAGCFPGAELGGGFVLEIEGFGIEGIGGGLRKEDFLEEGGGGLEMLVVVVGEGFGTGGRGGGLTKDDVLVEGGGGLEMLIVVVGDGLEGVDICAGERRVRFDCTICHGDPIKIKH